ncbi:MAG TPA: citramalate synthase [Candidatus Omnitrophota bacterium]|nr:citramalate synthase [Candidatus Omnitrophota bacterium]
MKKGSVRKIQLYDTTLRDGAQTEGISLSLADKLEIARKLDHFGMDYIEGGWPGSNPKDIEFFKEIHRNPLKHSRVVAFGSTRRAHIKAEQDPNLSALVDAKTKVVTIFGKSWDLHVTDVFKTSLKENLAMIRDSVAYLKSKKLEVIYDAEHFFDGFKSNREYALSTIREAAKAGADMIVLCDTNGGGLPSEVKRAVQAASGAVKVPIGIHCHNDMNLAVANSLAAVEQGCVQIQGTINGYGERCGNTDLTSVAAVLEHKMKMPFASKIRMNELMKISHFVAEVCNMPLQFNQPFVGMSAFAHKAGVHVDAMVKNAKTYEPLDPALVGNQRKFLISELSGKTNILAKAKEFDVDLGKESPEMRNILHKIRELENEGYQFEAAEASFELLVKKLTGKYHPYFDHLGFRVIDTKEEKEGVVSEASVKIKVKGEVELTAAEGDGPVNALDKALRKALKRFYPVIAHIHLTDYKVRVVNSQAGTAAKVRVFIQFQDEKKSWQTVGVSENIIEASWQALVDAVEYKLHKG